MQLPPVFWGGFFGRNHDYHYEIFKRNLSEPEFSRFAGIMNSLSGKSVLALCRVFSSPLSLPPAIVGAVRVCHTGVNSKGTVFTKKRGYDITRNPHLNKVSILSAQNSVQT